VRAGLRRLPAGRPMRACGFPHDGQVLKRIDHVGVIVDDLAQAKSFLADMGMRFDRDLVIPGRLRAAFYACGETQIEVIEIDEPEERARRLGDDTARVEHIALEVDSLSATLQALQGLGVRTTTSEPMAVGANLNYWTTAESCDGVQYQLIEKGAAARPS
jgi:methylmalonyl-CoA/ethylmalonyl-CoA epimerase